MPSAVIEISESFEVEHDPKTVWSVISDPRGVVTCMPGAALGAERADGSLDGTLTATLGPTVVTFHGQVSPSFDADEFRGSLTGSGADERGRSKAQVVTAFRVEPLAAGARSVVTFDVKCSVIGGIAPFLRTGGVRLARQMISEFADNLRCRCETAGHQGPDGVAAAVGIAARPPSVGRMTVRVLRDLLTEAARRMWRSARQTAGRASHPPVKRKGHE